MPLIRTTKTFWFYVSLAAVGYILWAGGVISGQPAHAALLHDNWITPTSYGLNANTFQNHGYWNPSDTITSGQKRYLRVYVGGAGTFACSLYDDTGGHYYIAQSGNITSTGAGIKDIELTAAYSGGVAGAACSWVNGSATIGKVTGGTNDYDLVYKYADDSQFTAYPVSYIVNPENSKAYVDGTTVNLIAGSDRLSGTASGPVYWQFLLEKLINGNYVAATVAKPDGSISTDGLLDYTDTLANEWTEWTPPGGTLGLYVGYGGYLRTVPLSGLSGDYRVSVRSKFAGDGLGWGAWSSTSAFTVGGFPFNPYLNPGGTSVPEGGPPEWDGISHLGSFVWDWVKFLLIPAGSDISKIFSDFLTKIADRWPISWFSDTIGGLISALGSSVTPDCPANSPNLFGTPAVMPNACWWAAGFRSLYGSWAGSVMALAAWLWAIREIIRSGRIFLGLDDGADDE